MLKPGTLKKIYSYYYSSPWEGDDLLRAFREFVGEKISKTTAIEKIGPQYEGYFNEWFLYDYLRTDGLTTLGHFVAKNPLRIADTDLDFYRKLYESNRYGLFEVLAVEQFFGMKLKDIQTGKIYEVQEMSATLGARPGSLMFGRVADVGPHWQLVGADTYSIRETDSSWINELRKKDFMLTPKDAYELLVLNDKRL